MYLLISKYMQKIKFKSNSYNTMMSNLNKSSRLFLKKIKM